MAIPKQYFTSFATFLFFALLLSVSSGYGYGALLLFLGAIFTKFFTKDESSLPFIKLWPIIFTLMLYFLMMLFDIVYHDLTIDFLDNPSRLVMAVIAGLLLSKVPPKISSFWLGIACGAISSGVLALYQKYGLHIVRPHGYLYPIQFGNLSILLGFLCLPSLAWAKQQKHSRLWKILLILGAILGLTASILSQTRGGWIAIPVILLILFFASSQSLSLKKLVLFSVIFISFSSLLYFVPQTGIKTRVGESINDLTLFQSGNNKTSIGTRFALWKTALTLTKEKPILGFGEIGYLDALKQRVDRGEAPEHLLNFNHVHNDYLDALVKRGIVGLVALLLFYSVPFIYYFRFIKSESINVRSVALSGVILTASYTVFSLTQGFLAHHSGVIVYAFSTVIIASLLMSELQRSELTKQSY